MLPRVALSRLSLDGGFERFAEQAEDDRVLADSQRVIGDFVVRTLAGAAFAAVDVVRLTHLARDDLTELEGRAAGGVLLVAVVSLDDLDIHAARMIAQGLPRLGHQLHRNVHGEAHARCEQDRRGLSGLFDESPLRGGQARGGDDQWNGSLRALLQDVHAAFGSREVDHDIHVLADLCDVEVVVADGDEAVATGACVQAAAVAEGVDASVIAARWGLGGGAAVPRSADRSDDAAAAVRTAYAALRDRTE